MADDIIKGQDILTLAGKYGFLRPEEAYYDVNYTDDKKMVHSLRQRSTSTNVKFLFPRYPRGELCTDLWGEGKYFGDVPTPKILQAKITSVIACPDYGASPDGEYLLEQIPGHPCQWQLEIPNWWNNETLTVYAILWDGLCSLKASMDPLKWTYYWGLWKGIALIFDNSIDECFDEFKIGVGGVGEITW